MSLLARIALPLALAAVLATSAACGGGGDKKAATPAADLSQATAASTRAASAPTAGATRGTTPTKAATTRTGTPATTTPKPSNTPASTSRDGLDSYHYVVEVEFKVSRSENGVTGTIEGDYVAPDSHSFTQTFEVAGIRGQESTVIIGDDAWVKKTSGDWRATDADDPDVAGSLDLTSADPTFFADDDFVDDLAVFEAKDDSVDGREARRYDFDRDQFEKLGGAFGSDFINEGDLAGITEFRMTVWVDEETERMIRAELIAAGAAEDLLADSPIPANPGDTASISLKFHITRLNDDAITIEPPI